MIYWQVQADRMTRLLVSVKDRNEAETARSAGVVWLDVKNPAAGSLGQASTGELLAIAQGLDQGILLSAALGELADLASLPVGWPWSRLNLVKVGLAGLDKAPWQAMIQTLNPKITELGTTLVLGAYADHERAHAPLPEDVLAFAIQAGMPALLIDTWCKDGTRLLDWLDSSRISELLRCAQNAGIALALAGSLDLESAQRLLPLHPAWLAVRGSVCKDGLRTDGIDPDRIKSWLHQLASSAG
jgi:uncharacterized protein (UPF0264 family)